jgi:hypothetical protein
MSRASFDIFVSSLVHQRIDFAYIVRLATCPRPGLLSAHVQPTKGGAGWV